MWSVNDMFYGRTKPVWILNHDKDDEKEEEEENAGEEGESSSSKEPEEEEYSGTSGSNEAEVQRGYTLTPSPYYPYYPNYSTYPAYRQDPYHYARHDAADSDEEAGRKERKVVMKVPICCSDCVESIKIPLLEMRGVKHVYCDIGKHKVTVITSTAAPTDILLSCRNHFGKSRMWTDED